MRKRITDYVPMYIRIQDAIRAQIERGELKAGDKIPTEKEMSAMFKVSRITATAAIRELVNDGLVYRKQGKGTFVARPKLEIDLVRMPDLDGSTGLPAAQQLLDFQTIRPAEDIRRAMRIPEGARVHRFTRTRLSNSTCIALEHFYLSELAFPGLTREGVERNPLQELLPAELKKAKLGTTVYFEPRLADAALASQLGVNPGAAVMYLERLTEAADGMAIKLCRAYVRGDQCRYYIRYSQEGLAGGQLGDLNLSL